MNFEAVLTPAEVLSELGLKEGGHFRIKDGLPVQIQDITASEAELPESSKIPKRPKSFEKVRALLLGRLNVPPTIIYQLANSDKLKSYGDNLKLLTDGLGKRDGGPGDEDDEELEDEALEPVDVIQHIEKTENDDGPVDYSYPNKKTRNRLDKYLGLQRRWPDEDLSEDTLHPCSDNPLWEKLKSTTQLPIKPSRDPAELAREVDKKFVRAGDALDDITESLLQSCGTGRKSLNENLESLVDDFAVVKGQVDTLTIGLKKGRSVDDAIEYHLQDFSSRTPLKT
ncbi:hypothetical protein DL770_005242 [Monosporascus sp. CRB-9-2]|nr:hypothetical protein DL770_005242 [Monosporascus sp. CRB-9-2]